MAIIFKDVSKTFGTNTVYENMNLTIREGETTVMDAARDVSLTRLIKVLDNGGKDIRIACGAIIRRNKSG